MQHLQVIFSNKIELLLANFSGQFKQCMPEKHFLDSEYVLIDNKMMGEWLNLQLADALGVAANITYIQPSSLFWQLAKCFNEKVPQEAPLQKEEMKWRLLNLLENIDLLSREEMAPVRHYLEGEKLGDLKRFQLAASIADLFDQYLIFRPQWLLAWQNNNDCTVSNDIANEMWQKMLWRELLAICPEETAFLHRAAIQDAAEKKLQILPSATIVQALPFKRLFVFGISSMPPALVRMLSLLAQHVPVTLFVLNPCREYWELIRSQKQLAKIRNADNEDYFEVGNPLLASQAVQIKEFIDQLMMIDNAEFLEDDSMPPQSLLHSIQHEILNLEYRGEPAQAGYVANGNPQSIPENLLDSASIPSVHIHQCHSAYREVEVMHDQIRDMLDKIPGLNPRDIVVMMPKVSVYSAYINAIFNSTEFSKKIPYHILDRTLAEESPLLNSFELLLKLPDSRFKLSEVLEILEVPAVQHCFEISQDHFVQLRTWLIESGARWGLDSQHREQFGSPSFNEYSWQFAFDRLFSGYGMAPTNNCLYLDQRQYEILPFSDIEGGVANVFNQFLQFWNALITFRKFAQGSHLAVDWYNHLLQMLADFYLPETDEDKHVVGKLRSALYEIKQVSDAGWYKAPISMQVIRDLIKPTLQKASAGKHHWQEGVKFCSLLPMRAVPFSVVYVMGMNLEDYPRRIEKKSFDLMRHAHEPGDRAGRIDDRWLFLEALLSARQVFHVSYIARDMHRNEKREPSVVLSELMAYIRHGYFSDSNEGESTFNKSMFTSHPLQSFNADYFLTDKSSFSPRLISYNRQAFAIAAAKEMMQCHPQGESRWQTKPLALGSVLNVNLNEFIRFFTKPWQWFFKNKCKLDLSIEDNGIKDDEDYRLADGLEKWQISDDLIKLINMQEVPEEHFENLLDDYIRQRKARAAWPVGISSINERLSLLDEKKKTAFYQSFGKDIDHIPIEYSTIQSGIKIIIKGVLPVALDANGERTILLEHTASKISDEKKLAFYIKALLARAAHIGVSSAECYFQESKAQTIDKESFADIKLAEHLQMLCSLFVNYQSTGLPYSVKLAADLMKLDLQSVSFDEDIKSLLDEYWFGDGQVEGVVNNIEQRSYFGTIEALADDVFYSVCEQLAEINFTGGKK